MQTNANGQEWEERLQLIETMMAEGRHSTESWGWTFVLWGVAYYVAMAWAYWGHTYLAWPVTMTGAFLLTAGLAARPRPRQTATTVGRAIGAVWVAMGSSLFILLLPMGMTGRIEQHLMFAIVGAFLGGANAASSMILRWKMQAAAAVVWWTAAVVACFASDKGAIAAFLVAIFFCQIVFGVYAMMADSRRRRRDAAHA
jgi:hypothetical protein